MMKIRLLSIGKTKASWLQEGMDEYSKRLKHYCRFENVEIPSLRKSGKLSHEEVARKEGEIILAKIAPTDYLVLLDIKSPQMESAQLASWLEKQFSRSQLVFLIGGAYGFSQAVYTRADKLVSLSEMTFSHQLVRLLFLEQLYRAHTILKGEPYHH